MNKVVVFLLFISLSNITFAKGGKVGSFSLMTYNLENFFDAEHDHGKNDYTYLPLKVKMASKEAQAYCQSIYTEHYRMSCLTKDWTQDKLDQKIKNLGKVITQYQNGGADILVFEEVENISVLNMLLDKGLKRRGYKYVTLIEGPDRRGIDVGMISRYPIVSQKAHQVDISPKGKHATRPVLEVVFQIGKEKVTILGNHWPAQGAPDVQRIIAAKALLKAALNAKTKLVIATGDFNTNSDDALNGITRYVLREFIDVEVKGRRYADVRAKGTHHFNGRWESLDKIFVLKSSLTKSKYRVDYFSYEIIMENFMLADVQFTDEDGEAVYYRDVPNRFDAKTGSGYSDHLPVAVTIDL